MTVVLIIKLWKRISLLYGFGYIHHKIVMLSKFKLKTVLKLWTPLNPMEQSKKKINPNKTKVEHRNKEIEYFSSQNEI